MTITYVINNCSICQIPKFDRKPVKTLYQVIETPTHFNDIVHIQYIDIWFPYRNIMHLTTMDKFSSSIIGKINKIVFENDRRAFVFKSR